MKENGHKDYLLLKSHAEFKELAAYDHFKKKARNQQYYKSRAASKANTDAGSVSSAKHFLSDHSITSRIPQSVPSFAEPKKTCEQTLPSLDDIEENKVENNEEKEAWTRWKDLIAQCEVSDYMKRCHLLRGHYFYDSNNFNK